MALDIDPVHDFGNFNHATDNSLEHAQGLFVVVSEEGDVSVNTTPGTKSFGVLRRGVTLGFVPPVRRAGGMAYVRKAAGYDPKIGDKVANDATGAAALATAGQIFAGIVVDTVSGADDEVRVLLASSSEVVA